MRYYKSTIDTDIDIDSQTVTCSAMYSWHWFQGEDHDDFILTDTVQEYDDVVQKQRQVQCERPGLADSRFLLPPHAGLHCRLPR